MVFNQKQTLPDSATRANLTQEKQGLCADCATALSEKNTQIRDHGFRSEALLNRPSQRVGYARVSTAAQELDRQLNQLETQCDVLHLEKLSAVAAERPVFDAVLADLHPGDTFVIVDLDRAFRSSTDAILTTQALRDRGVAMQVLNFPMDTSSDEGELFFTILAAFAQFERRMISRRTKEGLPRAAPFTRSVLLPLWFAIRLVSFLILAARLPLRLHIPTRRIIARSEELHVFPVPCHGDIGEMFVHRPRAEHIGLVHGRPLGFVDCHRVAVV
jgi:predicted site-specific integrase-resolvase